MKCLDPAVARTKLRRPLRVRVQLEPFLKWPGGKRFLARRIVELVCHSTYSRYIEPFAGGAAVFFALAPRRALISDCNEELINLYRVVRSRPRDLIRSVRRLKATEQAYYEIREMRPRTELTRARRLYYLMRFSFNGIYRESLNGTFNVPFGWKTELDVVDEDAILSASQALSSALLKCFDFREALHTARPGDLVYIDPPYTVRHNNNGFIKYNQRLFSWHDQVDLASIIRNLVRQDVHVIVSNADHSDVRALYANVLRQRTVERISRIAADATARVTTTEALFLSPSLTELWPASKC